MQRERRLRRRGEFDAVTRRGRSFAHPLVILRLSPNQSGRTRWGFAVGKRVGNAVTRNRVRRRLREIGRSAPVQSGLDVVLIARPDAAGAEFQQLHQAVLQLLARGRAIVRGGDEGKMEPANP